MRSRKVYAIILAGGYSERFAGEVPKQFTKIAGKMVVEHTIDIFERHPLIDEIFVVVNPTFRHLIEQVVLKNKYKKVTKILNGGKTRQESSMIGSFAIPENDSFVLIHDAVRPFVSESIISEVINALNNYEAVDVAIPSSDTTIEQEDMIIMDIPDRDRLMLGQTPQGFKTGIIKRAYEMYKDNPVKVTDDCGLIIKYNLGKIKVVLGDRFNIKITYPEDMYFADKIFQVRSQTAYGGKKDLLDLKDKVMVVFGASRGIGKSICTMAEKFGAKVYGFSRSNSCNIANPNNVQKALERVFEKEQRIDYVINTAGVLITGSLLSRDYRSIQEEIMTNYYGSIVVVKESFDYLVKSKGSLVLFASSSYTRGRALYSIYSSSKAAVVNLVQALAEEWTPHGCRVNVINPERTNTDMRKRNFGYEDPSTLLSPKEVAEATLKVLLSNSTGQVIDVRKTKTR